MVLGFAASVIAAAGVAEPGVAAAVESSRPCFAGVTVPYGKPLREMPPIRHAENAEPFHLGGHALDLFSPLQTVFVGPGRLGFVLSAKSSQSARSSPAPIRLTSELTQITRSGEPLALRAARHRLVSANGSALEEIEFGFDVPRDPSFYRVDITLATTNGQRVSYSEYFRVVKERPSKLRGRVTPRIVSPGGRLRWLIENPGTDWMWPSTVFPIEQLVDGQWVTTGPPGLLVEPQNILPGGLSFGCHYTLPASLEPGRYRLNVSVEVGGRGLHLLLPFEIAGEPSKRFAP